MSDFFQNGAVTSLHNLRNQSLEDLEAKICGFQDKSPVSLLLPSLYSEIDGKALPNIVGELKNVPYLSEIVIGLLHIMPCYRKRICLSGPRERDAMYG